MQRAFENVIKRLKSEVNYNDGAEIGLKQAIEIVKQEAEQYEECYNDCGDCEAYNKEKHHCPKFCKVIKETVKEIEENHNSLVSCSDRLPEEDADVHVWSEYIKEIEEIASKNTCSQSDGYSQIMRICEAMKEEQRYCLGYQSKNGIKSPQFD